MKAASAFLVLAAIAVPAMGTNSTDTANATSTTSTTTMTTTTTTYTNTETSTVTNTETETNTVTSTETETSTVTNTGTKTSTVTNTVTTTTTTTITTTKTLSAADSTGTTTSTTIADRGVLFTGDFEMTVSDANGFLSDSAAIATLREAISAYTSVFEEFVQVSVRAARRRLQGERGRRLQSGAVIVTYTITIPSVTPEGFTATGPSVQEALLRDDVEAELTEVITERMSAALGSAYIVVVTAFPEPVVQSGELNNGGAPPEGSGAKARMASSMTYVATLIMLALSLRQ